MIEVRAPRYHDRRVLLARYRLAGGSSATVKILYGAYKGVYKVSNQVICNSPIESMQTRSGNTIQMRAVALDDMERVDE